jgi:hypothetical protein
MTTTTHFIGNPPKLTVAAVEEGDSKSPTKATTTTHKLRSLFLVWLGYCPFLLLITNGTKLLDRYSDTDDPTNSL